nr:MAG TPA: hypothetical protein [Caudoviricetes sp.]
MVSLKETSLFSRTMMFKTKFFLMARIQKELFLLTHMLV